MIITREQLNKGNKKDGSTEVPETLEEMQKRIKKEVEDSKLSNPRHSDDNITAEQGMLYQDRAARGVTAFERAVTMGQDDSLIRDHPIACERCYGFEFSDMAGFEKFCSMLQDQGVPEDKVRPLGNVLGNRKYGEKQMGKIMQGKDQSSVVGRTPEGNRVFSPFGTVLAKDKKVDSTRKSIDESSFGPKEKPNRIQQDDISDKNEADAKEKWSKRHDDFVKEKGRAPMDRLGFSYKRGDQPVSKFMDDASDKKKFDGEIKRRFDAHEKYGTSHDQRNSPPLTAGQKAVKSVLQGGPGSGKEGHLTPGQETRYNRRVEKNVMKKNISEGRDPFDIKGLHGYGHSPGKNIKDTK